MIRSAGKTDPPFESLALLELGAGDKCWKAKATAISHHRHGRVPLAVISEIRSVPRRCLWDPEPGLDPAHDNL